MQELSFWGIHLPFSASMNLLLRRSKLKCKQVCSFTNHVSVEWHFKCAFNSNKRGKCMFYFILCLWVFLFCVERDVLDMIDNSFVCLCPQISHFFPLPWQHCSKQLTSFSLIEEQESPKVYWCGFHESNWLGQRRKLLLMPVLRKRQKHESDKSAE